MPPYKDFALGAWSKKHIPNCRIHLQDSMVIPLTLQDLQAYDPTAELFSPASALTYVGGYGRLELRQNIASLYQDPNGKPAITPQDVLVTGGAQAANRIVLETLLEAGDSVIVESPAYGQLVEIPRRLGASVHLWRQKEQEVNGVNTFVLDVDDLEKQIEQVKPKLLILNNPSNPAGALLNAEELLRIIKICASQDVYILCDEVFRFLHHDTNIPIPPSISELGAQKCISTSAVSKAFSAPGLRVGWIITSPDLRDDLLKQFESSSSYGTLAVGSIDQEIATFTLREDVRTKILDRNREICQRNIEIIREWAERNKENVIFYFPGGAGTCIIKLKNEKGIIDDAEFARQLVEKEKVFIPPAGVCFGDEADGSGGTDLHGGYRIGIGIEEGRLRGGLEAIERLLKHWN